MSYDKHGKNNPRWKGGRRIRSDGYVICYAPGHPYACRDFVLEHRLVMEAAIGRYLEPHELVHHKNEVKHDNRIENLELTSHAEHARHHFTGVKFDSRWQPKVEKDVLVELYVNQRLPMRAVGNRVGISYGSVRFHLAFFNIEIRKGQRHRIKCTRLTTASRLFKIRESKSRGDSIPHGSTSKSRSSTQATTRSKASNETDS